MDADGARGVRAAAQTEMLFETTPLMAKLYGWYWPTSEQAAYTAERAMLALVQSDVKQR